MPGSKIKKGRIELFRELLLGLFFRVVGTSIDLPFVEVLFSGTNLTVYFEHFSGANLTCKCLILQQRRFAHGLFPSATPPEGCLGRTFSRGAGKTLASPADLVTTISACARTSG